MGQGKPNKESVLSLLEEPNESIREIDFSKGIFHAKDLAEGMKYTFKNGKKRGETTRFHTIDPHFTWKKGEVTCVTGYANSGKTEFMLQLMTAKSIYDQWKWVVFCPENFPIDEIYDTIIHAYVGKTTDPKFHGQMSEEEYDEALLWVDKYFILIHPPEEHTIELVFKYFKHVIDTVGDIDGCMSDPWNQFIHEQTNRDDQYLSNKLSVVKRFAQDNNICKIIIAHPNQPKKKEDGSFPVADQFCLNGGAMWNNKMDNILSINRPYYHKDKTDTTVEFHSLKIKKQKLVGIPGMVTLTFDRRTNRYYEYNGLSPLEPLIVPAAKPLIVEEPTEIRDMDSDFEVPF